MVPRIPLIRLNLRNYQKQIQKFFATDKIPEVTPSALIESLNAKSQSSTGGLAQCLHLKKAARVMLTVNIDVSDRLANGELGTLDNLVFTEYGVSKI